MRLVFLILLCLTPTVAFANNAGEIVQFAAIVISVVFPVSAPYMMALTMGVSAYGAHEARKIAAAEREKARERYNNGLKDRTITRVATDAPHRTVYGRARVGSDIVAMFSGGDRDEYKYLVCVHAAHECDAIEEIYIGGKALGTLGTANADGSQDVTPASADYWSEAPVSVTETFTGTTITLAHTPIESTIRLAYDNGGGNSISDSGVTLYGAFTLASNVLTTEISRPYTVYYDWSEAHPRVRVTKHLGTPTEAADASLITLTAALTHKWTADSVLRGYCYTVVRLDLNQAEFQSGIPPIEVLLRGKKLYDLRDGTTVWSQNTTLAVYDYLTGENCSIPAADLPAADYIAAANACAPITGCTYTQSSWNVTVTKTAHGFVVGNTVEMQFLTGTAVGGTFTITAATADTFSYIAYIWNGTGYLADSRTTSGNATIAGRYTINGTVSSDQDQKKTLDNLAQCMAGTIVGTTWSLSAGVYTGPVMALDESDIVGQLAVTSGVSDADLANGITGQFISSENSYVATDFAPYQDAVYLAADGRELWLNVEFPFTDQKQRVHNLCAIVVEDMRNGFTIKAAFSYKAYAIKCGRRVSFTSSFLGQTAKVYRVIDKRYGLDQAIELTLKEDDATIWDLSPAVSIDATPNTNLSNPWSVAAPSLGVTFPGWQSPERVTLGWIDTTNVRVVHYQAEYFGSRDATWKVLPLVAGTPPVSHLNIDNLQPDTYIFRVKAINSLGVSSPYSATQTAEVQVLPVPDVSGLEIFGRGNSEIFGGKHCRLTWRKSSMSQSFDIGSELWGANSGALDYYFKDYVIKVSKTDGTLLRTEYVTDENYIYTFEHNAEDNGGVALREFVVQVWQRGKYGQLSAIPATITPSNPVSDLPLMYVLEGTDTVTFTYDEPADLDWDGVRIWLSTTSGFTPGTANLVYAGIDAAATVTGILPNTTYYYRYAVKDQFGDGATSAEGSFSTQLSNQSLVSSDAIASVSFTPDGADRNDGFSHATGSGVLLSTLRMKIPKIPCALKLSVAAMGVMTRTATTPTTFTHYMVQALAIKNMRKLTGTISIASSGAITGTGTAFLSELQDSSQLILNSETGCGTFCTTSGGSGIRPVWLDAPISDTSVNIFALFYTDTGFTYSGEAWVFDTCAPTVSMPTQEVMTIGNAAGYDSRPHAAFVREFTLAEITALLADGATHLLILSTASEGVSTIAPAASPYSIERNVVMASIELL
jgi:hypothetical protein